jgi:hypothetical protein
MSRARRCLWIACLSAGLLAGSAGAQRCGDHLFVSLLDADGKPIPPSELTMKVRVTVHDINHWQELLTFDPTPEIETIPEGRTVHVLRTDCGLVEAAFQIGWKGRRMDLAIRDVPGDAGNILLGDVAFAEGAYTIELTTPLEESCVLLHSHLIEGIEEIGRELWSIRKGRLIRVIG